MGQIYGKSMNIWHEPWQFYGFTLWKSNSLRWKITWIFFFRGQKGILQHAMFDPRRVYGYIWFIVILIMGMGTLYNSIGHGCWCVWLCVIRNASDPGMTIYGIIWENGPGPSSHIWENRCAIWNQPFVHWKRHFNDEFSDITCTHLQNALKSQNGNCTKSMDIYGSFSGMEWGWHFWINPSHRMEQNGWTVYKWT